jgi:predicted DNA-binding protein with PD1-like motif
MVGVGVRLEDACEPQASPLGLVHVLLDRVRGVDDDRLGGPLVTDQIRTTAEVVVHELPKDHLKDANTERR